MAHDAKQGRVQTGLSSKVRVRFETAVFLIAAGLGEKDDSYEANASAYPYSDSFRHGLNIFSALCSECGGSSAAGVLGRLNESDFIRSWCTRDVRTWVEGWDEGPRAEILSSEYADLGPLAQMDEGFFALTDDCWDLIILAESDVLGAFQERSVYQFLREGSQEQYAFGRRLLIRHPLLSWDERSMMHTGRYDFGADPLDCGEAANIELDWLRTLLEMAYEEVPSGMKVCPRCGWTMGVRGRQPYCSSRSCRDGLPADLGALEDVSRGTTRLLRGVMRYIALPGALELAIAEFAQAKGFSFELWPEHDTCDLIIKLPGGGALALDAKAYVSAARLMREVRKDDALSRLEADELIYVIPDEMERERPGSCALCSKAIAGKAGYSCMTFSGLRKRLAAIYEEGL